MQGLEKVLGTRFARQFGIGIPDSEYPPNFMVPRFTDGRPAREPISPNRFFSEEKTELSIDGVKLEVYMIRTNVCQSNNDTSRGVRLEVYMIPGEKADHVAVWLPDSQVLFAGDHVYGSFPISIPYVAVSIATLSAGPGVCVAWLPLHRRPSCSATTMFPLGKNVCP